MPLPDDVNEFLRPYEVPNEVLELLGNTPELEAYMIPKPPGVPEDEVRFLYQGEQRGSAYLRQRGRTLVIDIRVLDIKNERYPRRRRG